MTTTDKKIEKPEAVMRQDGDEAPPGDPSPTDLNAKSVSALLRQRFGVDSS